MTVLAYQVAEIPDPFFPQYQVEADGDVLGGVGKDFEHLLRTVASFQAGSVSIAFHFCYTPKSDKGDLQSRLKIRMFAKAHTPGNVECLRLLFEHGPFTRFYPIEKIKPSKIFLNKYKESCEIVRRENAIDPLHSAELNDRIPPYYYMIQTLMPNERNDYLALDRLLAGLREEVLIAIIVQPADVSAELSVHTRYLSMLQSINRTWDWMGEEQVIQDYFDDSPGWYQSRGQNIKPLRYPDPLADEILRSQQRFHETLLQPHLHFNINVLTQTKAAVHLAGSVLAESAIESGSYRLLFPRQNDQFFKNLLKNIQEIRITAHSVHKDVFEGKDYTYYQGLSRLSHVATVEELSGICRLPVSSNDSPLCIKKNTDPGNNIGEKKIIVGYDHNTFFHKEQGVVRGAESKALCKSFFVSGVPGPGKTTAASNLMLQIHEHGIPFLVIEPAKTEYRIFKSFQRYKDKNAQRLARQLEIYTPGNEDISPLRYNPLDFEPGISVNEHIDNILSCFLAAMPVSGPLPALLGEALERVYYDHPKGDDPPIMAELVAATEQVLAEKGYSSETNSDIQAALEVRLSTLIRRNIGRVFQCRQSFPSIEHLMATPTVIELNRLTQEQGCLLSLFLLTSILEHLKILPQNNGNLRYIIFIEEAHNIAGSSNKATANPDIADPAAFSTELICRMLAELRALGVGMVIIDQFPSAVAPTVIKSTTTKLAFRQVAKEDREEIGAAMLFGKTEMEDIARLGVGEAFFITEGYHKPRRIKTVNLHESFNFNVPVLNEEILPYLRNDAWFKEAAVKRIGSELSWLCQKMDSFDNARVRIMHELSKLFEQYLNIVKKFGEKSSVQILKKLSQQALTQKKRLKTLHENFSRLPFTGYLYSDDNSIVTDKQILDFREHLVSRFQFGILPDIKKTFEIIDKFLARCQ